MAKEIKESQIFTRKIAIEFVQKSSRHIEAIVIHCSATPASRDIGAIEIDRMHRQKGWREIGYHLVIRRDGTLEYGRPMDLVGAHVEGHNANTIGVCMIGGVNDELKVEDNFTDEQWETLFGLLIHLRTQYPEVSIVGHRDYPGVHKDCPSFDVKEFLLKNNM